MPSKSAKPAQPKRISQDLAAVLEKIQSANGIRRRVLIAKALSILYGVSTGTLLGLTYEDLDFTVEKAMIRIKGKWIPAEEYRDLIVGLVPSPSNGALPAQKLFPGRNVGDALSTAAARYHIRRALES